MTLPSGASLHLSEHNGDGTPRSILLVPVEDLDREVAEMTASGWGAPPTIEESRMGRSIIVHDSTGNRIVFVSTLAVGHRYSDESLRL
ncbi:glyoxalase superfamily protein [Microlunatus elymi]|uniref:glyoxalase superfamily protein n=1 Tax=Microlunatus elymi TaxID=2596828 RepID=UPI0038992773